MKLTRAHADFWAYHHTLSCLRGALKGTKVDDVNRLIPESIEDRKRDYRFEARNTLALIRSMERRMSTSDALIYLAASGLGSRRRRGYCRKWLKRIRN
jgi:hypothetical protein